MEENNKQDPKFKELSTKKKVIHYVGWPLLVLGCVGTIVFGSLWCRKGNGAKANDPYSGETIEYTFTSDDRAGEGFYTHYLESPSLHKVYQFNFPTSLLVDDSYDSVDYMLFFTGFGGLGHTYGIAELEYFPLLYINDKIPSSGTSNIAAHAEGGEGDPSQVLYFNDEEEPEMTLDTNITIKLIYESYEDNEIPGNQNVLVCFMF